MRKDKERDDEKVIASLSDINTIKRTHQQKDQIIKFIELENPITGFPRGTITFIAMLPSASLPELADCTIGEFKEAESFATSLCESIEFANNKLKKTDLDHSEALKKIAEESDSTIFF